MPFNVHQTVGNHKGRFIKKAVKRKLETFVDCVQSKKRRESEVAEKFIGRRIVELDLLAQELWCTICNQPLSLRNALKETSNGLFSEIDVQCGKCFKVFKVKTSKQSLNIKFPDVNLKLAVGMLDAGMGERNVNTLLSSLNIPAVGKTSLKRWEREVGQKIVHLVDEVCKKNIELEKQMTVEQNRQLTETGSPEKSDLNNDCNDDSIIDLGGSFDAAWPKKGTNSLCGHSSLIGKLTGKIMGIATRSVVCRKCKNKAVCIHMIKNHVGSAKSMEADMAVEVILKNNNLVEAKCRIKVLIADDDSSVIAALRRLSPYAIEKWADFNHTHKTFNTKLYEAKLTPVIREYFSKNFALCIQKNKGNANAVKAALENLVPHAFGVHDRCLDWCIRDENNIHIYKYFKDGKCLTDSTLKANLEKALQPYINSSEQIAPCGSSQSNESFNFIVTTKYPKSKHFGGSDSHKLRVGIAVLQKDFGFQFISILFVKLLLSPGKNTIVFREKKDKNKEKDAAHKQSIPGKCRRMLLKQERSSTNSKSTNKEGICYESGMGYLNTSDLVDETLIPDAFEHKDCSIVVFDTETTGLRSTDEIIQIAAKCGSSTFEVCIKPLREISDKASEVTGFKMVDGDLLFNNKIVETLSARDAFISFLYFLKIQKSPCILVAHNCFRFDAPRIIRLAKSLSLMRELMTFVKGFGDSLIMFRELLPQRLAEKKSFSQPILVEEFLDKSDILPAHNAMNDVIMLHQLIQVLCKDKSIIFKNTQSISYITNAKERKEKIKASKESLQRLGLSTTMTNKIAKAGIDFTALQKAHETGGYEALKLLLGEAINKKPRVTTNKKIITTIFENFAGLTNDSNAKDK